MTPPPDDRGYSDESYRTATWIVIVVLVLAALAVAVYFAATAGSAGVAVPR